MARKPRDCEVCGQTYSPTYGAQRTCGRTCGAIITGRLAGVSTPWRSPLPLTRCETCSAWMVARRSRRYCSTACAPSKYQPRGMESKQCATCESDFTYLVRRGRQPAECPPCADVTYRQRKAEQRKAATAKFGRVNKDRRRARRYGVEYEPIDRAYVFERDGYRCHICGKKCRVNVEWSSHPLDPTIDHLIPISQGGPHTLANVATACFMCNSLKSNGSANDQLLLIG